MSGQPHAFGIDIGGSGIKGAVVARDTGELVQPRQKVPTPQPATPQATAEAVATLVTQAHWEGPIGITLPSVIRDGVACTAANIDPSWIGTDAVALFQEALGGQTVTVLNDADAAGIAEYRFGAARTYTGLVMLLTFGTGIGSALLSQGVLVPNSELGHLELNGREIEHWAAASIKDQEGLTYPQWAARVSTVLIGLEKLFWPRVFVVGGGISRDANKWISLLTNQTPVVPAHFENTAGIVGAALAAEE